MSRQQDPLTIDFLLLGLIGQNPVHAYELYKKLTKDPELKTIWTFRQSRLYAVLDKIEKNGLIKTTVDPSGQLPVRRICQLTNAGYAAFEEWLHTPTQHVNELRSDFLAKLYFLKDRPEAERRGVIDAQIVVAEKWYANASKKLKEYSDPASYLYTIYSFRAHSIEAALAWLNERKEI